MSETHTYGDGTTVEIPDGSEIERDEHGDVLYWRLPAITPEGELHPDQVAGYEPHLDRLSTGRRLLGHITDEDHVGRGPRNTVERLTQELAEDPHTPMIGLDDNEAVSALLTRLVDVGLVQQRKNGTYTVTKAGRVELAN